MIEFSELIKEYNLEDIPKDHQNNLLILLERLNQLRKIWAKPMIITSAYRSMEHHLAIYHKRGIYDKSKIPMQSRHLTGQACDIYDEHFSLTNFCKKDNSKLIISIGLWCEDDKSVPRLHVQTISPPNSDHRWFKPY